MSNVKATLLRTVGPAVFTFAGIGVTCAVLLALLMASEGDWGYLIILGVMGVPFGIIFWKMLWPKRRDVVQGMKEQGYL